MRSELVTGWLVRCPTRWPQGDPQLRKLDEAERESWHNNHHAFPSSAFHGLRRLEIDPGGWLIWTFEKCGLAWRVVRIPPQRQAAKLSA